MTVLFCPECGVEGEIEIREGKETFHVKGEPITVQTHVAVCVSCEEEILDRELDSANLERAFTIYRQKHSLLSPTDIVRIRQKYGLSQRALARLLQWGDVTIHRYENGAIQDKVHDEVLRFIEEPRNMNSIYKRNTAVLPKTISLDLGKRLHSLLNDEPEDRFRAAARELLDTSAPGPLNGFKRFDLEAMENAILFIVSSVEHSFKSKVLKLLWYVDFLCYNETAHSLTGSKYEAAPFGPVPREYRLLLTYMDRAGVIKLQEDKITADGTDNPEIIVPQRRLPTDAFSDIQRRCLEQVCEEFKHHSANATETRTHDEKAYQVTRREGLWETIPYTLANTLTISL
jgi:putative zinc finger/helix-turn-helix YgiT family protein